MTIENLLILTDEQLAAMAKEGSETAEEILIDKYKGLAKLKAKAYFIAGGDQEDVVQEGMIGLMKAVRNFDPEREASFKTFASTCITNQIIKAIRNADREKNHPLNEAVS
ncbi:MAG: sigma-70 family RNA polymerase sigma factor, partial [Firmicutes bacterium]|nr:sigma-70 family RNA polymerase sigma factor [Bacillota bacterium]